MKRHLALAWLLMGLALMLVPFSVFLNSSASDSKSRAVAPGLARMGDQAVVRAEGGASPGMNLAGSREMRSVYTGELELQRLLRDNMVQPLAMASGDFDEDGMPDLISAYAGPAEGIIAMHRGNADAMFPQSPEANQRKNRGEFTDAPFLEQARVFRSPERPDFIGAGDFDADGHWDVVTASRGSRTVYLLKGDGQGGLSTARELELSGTVTTLIAGDVNRADGLADLIVGIQAFDGPKALVFEGPDGALESVPETFSLPAQASSLALGRFDNDYLVDLAIGAGRYLVVVYGRDRKLSLGEMARHQASEATIIRQSFPHAITSIVGGDFAGEHEEELAIRSSDGKVRLMEANARGRKWAARTFREPLSTAATLIVKARLSGRGKDDLLAFDSSGQQFHTILSGGEIRVNSDTTSLAQSLSVDGEPVAVLPMKLNGDALTDLVTMKSGRSAPSILLSPAVTTFTVSVANDGLGFPNLRQAIMDANTTPGADLIVFNIPPAGPKTIQILTALPSITEAVTIDGTTQPGFAGTPIIELDGSLSPAGTNALLIAAGGSSTVRGLVINRFSGSGYGIRIQNNAGNIVEGNYIGTDPQGNVALPNGRGIFINGSPNNQIGGTTAAARNVISGNTGNGIDIQGTTAFGNRVQGNFIGTNATGSTALANGGFGISVQIQANATIGGTSAGAGNVISANIIGIAFGAAGGSLVQGNLIGTDVTGAVDLGNETGVQVTTASPNNTFGGTTAAARNVVSGNNINGFQIRQSGTNGNIVQGNFIGTQTNGVSPLGNGLNGVIIENAANNNSVGGAAAGAGNVIWFNSRNGVAVSGGTGNLIGGNSIVFNNRLGIDLNDDIVVTPNDVCDGDLGPNNLQNFPVLTSASSIAGMTTIVGTLNSTAGTNFRIEFFSTDGCDPSGSGEGQTFIGSTTVSTAGLCDVPINVTLPVAVAVGNVITATATDPANNTSEFSQCVIVAAGPCTISCPPNQTSANDPNQCGAVVTYPPPSATAGCGTVTCSPASGSFFPRGATTVVCNTTAGPNCSFTVTVNDTQPPTITCPPNQTAAGGVPTVVNYPAPTVSDNCPGATAVCVPPSGSTFPVGTTPVTCFATDASANASSCTFTVTVTQCTIACSPNLTVGTGPNATQCSSNVIYQAPTTLGACGAVTCAPPSGSAFALGTTTVSCTTNIGPSCSFSVTVVDDTPPRINCSTGVTAPLPAGQSSAVVNYPAATATDNCTATTVDCVPPSGSTFPVGATLVTCTATDTFANANRCFFFVTVLDAQAPIIRCPANVNAALPSGQTSAVVNYPPPTVTDNLPGVSVSCLPASGSSFPAGTTTVTCTATDAGGNKSSCSFIVGVGGPLARVTIPGNKATVEFATVSPKRKSPKPKNNPCSLFTVENVGFAPLILTFDSIARTGSAVDSGRITDPNDTRFFSLSIVNSDQSLTPLDIGAVLTLQPGQGQNLCARFAALLPALAGKTTGLAASNVLPDVVTSKIVFRQNAGANIAVPILARVSTALVLVNLSNPRTMPEVLLTRSGNDFTVSFAVFDSNLDVSRAKYEFLNGGGQVVAGPFEIDLAGTISSANLLRGQSFSVDQRFTGASSHPEVTRVRLTVFDGESSDGSSSASFAASISAASVQLMNRARRVTLYPPDAELR